MGNDCGELFSRCLLVGIVSPLAQALSVAMALTMSPIAHGCGMEADLLTWCIIMLQSH